ncbi:MAG: lipid asymmetry maintenance protein MlaB [Terracidiphilus sp.]
MTCKIPIPIDTAIFPAVERTELTELVRGNEQGLLAWLSPLARRQSVTLDMSSVERIDAAGIAALISLHASARETGHSFTVANLSPHVAEILSLVGLERILLSHDVAHILFSGSRMESSAA